MILVTGATGLVGCRLVFDLVSKGHQVRGLKRTTSNLDFVRRTFAFYDASKGTELFKQIEWIDGDILDTETLKIAFEGIKTVYHCAALVSYRSKDYDNLISINQDGTANVVNTALAFGVEKFCQLSSVAALGKAKTGELTNEDSEWIPDESHSNYSLSKFLAEQEVWRGIAEGLNAIIVNPSIILGPALADQSSGMLMATLQKGLPYFPKGQTGYVDVRDVSKMAIALMEKGSPNQRYLLNSENLPFKALLEISAKTFDKAPPRFLIPQWGLEIAWILSAVPALFGSKAKITKETARSASGISSYDNAKVKKETGLEFTTVAESLAYFCEFFA